MLTVGSLFSGIGGLELGLERTGGFKTIWQVEIDPFCRRVLEKHWPDVTRYEDIKDVGVHNLKPVDLVAGGVPCQPISQAAARTKRAGGWLWPEFRRIVAELKPRFALLENPEALRYADRGLGEVLSDVAALGYDARWQVLPASACGAPHRRARIWLVAYANSNSEPDLSFDDEAHVLQESGDVVRQWPNPPEGLGVADGVPDRVDRIGALGNAVVPQVAEWIGRRILAAA